MIGVIGGSGLYEMEGLENKRWQKVSTPFGDPSDEFLLGCLAGRDVAFLPRHARGHRILPSELNHRANIWAFKSLGATHLLSVSAVGSLQEKYRPLDIVLPDQFIDRTKQSLAHTFFGNGIVAHAGFSDPICKELQQLVGGEAAKVLAAAGSKGGAAPRVHMNGVYVNMEGPAFSTRAESNLYRQWGADVIGMTNLGEAKLAREAEIAYASMSMITDYDCWKTGEEVVALEMIIKRLTQNAANAKAILKQVIPLIPADKKCSCHGAIQFAIATDKKLWPPATVEKLRPILARLL
ncbi:MAG: S-methyl-5'-thioadenosine phosphorylase [Verrucomicrobiae bacterium]|nr:S-methyl-5'-thioadenosine phosphorylase [Verrucomicrobiae bacterium]